MSIPVYFLRSRDKRVGFCFKVGNRYSIYHYVLSDISEWSGSIMKLDALDTDYWIESTETLSTTSVQLSAYDGHITAWAAAANYSLFEGLGRTEKNFVEETVLFFRRAGGKLVSLTLPRVMSRELTSRTSNLAPNQVERAREWSFLIQQVGYSDSDLVEYIIDSGSFYYKTRAGGIIRSFYADQIQVVYSDEPIILPSDDPPTGTVIPAALVPATASTSCYSSRPSVGYSVSNGDNSTLSSSELVIAIMLFTILIVLIVIAVIILEQRSESELIRVPSLASVPSVIPI